MKRKLKLVTVILLIGFNGFAQTLKKFNGELKGGKISYTYYENENSEMIRNGKFNYSKKETGFSYLISGSFKEGKRNGTWSYSIILTNYESDNSTSYSGTKKLTMSYLNGLPNGLCTFNSSLKVRYKKYINGAMRWGNYDKSTNTKITMNFINGILVGRFNIQDGLSNEFNSGSFNEESFANGNFVSTDNLMQTKTTATYLNGIPTKFNKINLRTGKIIYSLSQDTKLEKLQNDYANGKITVEDIQSDEKYYYKIDTVHSIAPIKTAMETYIYSDDFMYYEIGGDLNYNNGNILFGDNKAIILQKYAYQELGSGYKQALMRLGDGNYEAALSNLNKIKEERLYLSLDDKKELLEKIDLCKHEINKKNELILKKYNLLVASGDSLFLLKKYEKSSNKYIQAVDNIKFKIKDFDYNYATLKSEEASKLHKQQRQKKVDLETKSQNKESQVKSKYLVYDPVKSQITGQVEYKAKKKKLYNAYLLLLKESNQKLENAVNDNNLDGIITALEYKIALLDRMIVLSNEPTKPLEKSLKGVTELSEIKKLIQI